MDITTDDISNLVTNALNDPISSHQIGPWRASFDGVTLTLYYRTDTALHFNINNGTSYGERSVWENPTLYGYVQVAMRAVKAWKQAGGVRQ